MKALYNEIDPFATAWLRNLAAAGHIAGGAFDERSIADLRAADVRDAVQAHFFAGIGVWSYALKLAGWPDDVPVWTGSCPCQPFSAAGKRAGVADPRHLWPEWFRLIRQCRPPVIFGEQVASAGDWLDLVSSDLEREGYAFGAAVLGSHSVGAPHIRQRLYFVAYAGDERRDGVDPLLRRDGPHQDISQAAGSREAGSTLAHALRPGRPERRPSTGNRPTAGSGGSGQLGNPGGARAGRNGGAGPGAEAQGDSGRSSDGRFGDGALAPGAVGLLGDAGREGLPERERDGRVQREALGARPGQAAERGSNAGGMANSDGGQSGDGDIQRGGGHLQRPQDAAPGFWSDAEWIPCRDGKSRPVEPGTFPLAHGAASRVGRLRAYGNALNAEQAALFIRAAMSSLGARA